MNKFAYRFHIKYFEEKKRFLLFGVLLFVLLLLSFYLIRLAYSRYEVKTKINANIDKALYILDTDGLSFNLEPKGIVPSSEPYVYKFSLSNFKDNTSTDVDIDYKVNIRTTTNLPISIKLYRNELYTDSSATNLFSGSRTATDSDGAWYRIYEVNDTYSMMYEDKVTDVFTIVVDFPEVYKNSLTYSDYIESIEVNIESKQMA